MSPFPTTLKKVVFTDDQIRRYRQGKLFSLNNPVMCKLLNVKETKLETHVFLFELDEIGSVFTVIEATYEQRYCTLSRPPDIIKSVSDIVNITFERYRVYDVHYSEGFRLKYQEMNTSYEHMINFETRRTEGMICYASSLFL
jgi:hypothetical protein